MPGAGTTTGAAGASGDAAIAQRSLGDTKVPYEVLRYIPEESATHYRLVPLGISEGVLEVGMLDPEDIQGIDALNFIARTTGMPFKIFQVSQEDFDRVLSMYRGLGGEAERAGTDLQAEQKLDKIKE